MTTVEKFIEKQIQQEKEIELFLQELPSPLKVNPNKTGKHNIPLRFVGMLENGTSILRNIKLKEAVNLLGSHDSPLQKFIEATTINLGDIIPTITIYSTKIQKHLDDIADHLQVFGIIHPNLFTPTIFNSYSSFKKEVILGLKHLRNAGLTDRLCEQATNMYIEIINEILTAIRRYYFWSICSTKTIEDIRNERVLRQIMKTYNTTVKTFELEDISV